MRLSARMTSKGQLTVPKRIRELLMLQPGDEVVFDVDERGITFGRVPNFIELAGSVAVPPDVRGLSWEEIEERASRAWVEDSP
jgi:AbrB family looped-hinge helix DNA binding protein